VEGFVHLIDDKGDPYWGDTSTGLADQIFQTCHMGQCLVFPMPAVAVNLKNPGFNPNDPMTLFVGMLG
jgi:hypothetical protein